MNECKRCGCYCVEEYCNECNLKEEIERRNKQKMAEEEKETKEKKGKIYGDPIAEVE